MAMAFLRKCALIVLILVGLCLLGVGLASLTSILPQNHRLSPSVAVLLLILGFAPIVTAAGINIRISAKEINLQHVSDLPGYDDIRPDDLAGDDDLPGDKL